MTTQLMKLAIEVFGTRERAEEWLRTPAMALDQRRPIDLLGSKEGIDLVDTFLIRIKFGVYT